MNILITGGLGYVGGRLCEYFSNKKNHQVYALSRSKKIDSDQFKVLTNSEVLIDGALNEIKIDVLIHLAAANEIECSRDPIKSNEININGTLTWLEWAKKNQVGQFIYFSTVHVYGRPLIGQYDEDSPCNPLHPYSITHKAAEDYCNWYRFDHGLNTKIVRLSNSFGYPAFETANRWTLLVSDVCKQIVKGHQFELYSNIKQRRDFIPLSNVCDAVEKIIEDETNEHLFNLTNGQSYKLKEIALIIKEIAEEKFGKAIEFRYDQNKEEESAELLISNNRLRSIGWSPDWNATTIEISKTLDFFSKFPDL